jgi:hypothetical protein
MSKSQQVFWGEIAPSDHFLQFYESDEEFIDTLETFASSGFENGDGVIVIATEQHLEALSSKLAKNFNISELVNEKHYIPVDAEKLLGSIMNDDYIDEANFHSVISGLIESVKKRDESNIRVFGELVALLWGQGNRKATVEMEKLWHKICSSGVVCLFCAYPKTGFRQDSSQSIKDICSFHTHVVEKNQLISEINIYGEKYITGIL